MKHSLQVTIMLVLFFFLAQVIGLLIINSYIDHRQSIEKKETVMKPLPYGIERPEIENKSVSFVYIVIAIIIGTLLVLLLIKLNKPSIWKFWFFVTVWATLSIALAAFLNAIAAAFIALALAILKLYRPNVIVQNISEIFIYGGLASVFVPIIDKFAAFMLLIVISVYDYISVFKTKHMVKMATFQSQSKVFAGLLIPYNKQRISLHRIESNNETSAASHALKQKASVAVLGGGDIGFTLIFAGVVMKDLMLKEALQTAFLKTLIIPVVVTITLLVLLLKGEKNKFYPAMPFLSIGCLVGYLIVWLI